MRSALQKGINNLAAKIGRQVNIMEVCGTHTEVITTSGLRQRLPANLNLLTGPGCPVCVTPVIDIDKIIALAEAGIPIYSYGDALRVPGSRDSLESVRARGALVREIYSTEEIPADGKSVFFALGFETTAPMTAAAIKRGVIVYSSHKYFPPAMQKLVGAEKIQIDGFIDPGHVAAIIGVAPFRKIKKPQVVTGFEPNDILLAIEILLLQIISRKNLVQNEYARLVKPAGNIAAQKLLSEVFMPETTNWRGLGDIARSGMKIRAKYKKCDARVKYSKYLKSIKEPKENPKCLCGQVIQGLVSPRDCSLFGGKCRPQNPVGACMVSKEGACRIAYEN